MEPTPFVIFDLDGTLVETRGDIADAVNAGLSAVGLPTVPEPVITDFVGDGVGRLVDRTVMHVGGDVALAPAVVKGLVAYYRAHPVVHTHAYPGVDGLLARWAGEGRDLAVCSNKITDLCETIVARMGWLDRFRVVIGGDWGGARKPSPEPLLHIAERLGRAPAQGVMIGDSRSDLEAARAAGMRAVAALYGFRQRQELLDAEPDAALERPADLPAALTEMGLG